MTPPDETPVEQPPVEAPADGELTEQELDGVAGGSVLFPGGRNRSTVSSRVGGERGRESTQLGLSRRGVQNRQ